MLRNNVNAGLLQKCVGLFLFISFPFAFLFLFSFCCSPFVWHLRLPFCLIYCSSIHSRVTCILFALRCQLYILTYYIMIRMNWFRYRKVNHISSMRCDESFLKGLLNIGAAGVDAKSVCHLLRPVQHDIFQPMSNKSSNESCKNAFSWDFNRPQLMFAAMFIFMPEVSS